MPVELAATGHRPLAPDVQRRKRVEVPGIRNTSDHSVLLLYRRIGSGRLRAAEFERRTVVLVEIGEIVEALTVSVGKCSGSVARTAPVAPGTGVASSVTRRLQTPL
jgi:hypothetical protein